MAVALEPEGTAAIADRSRALHPTMRRRANGRTEVPRAHGCFWSRPCRLDVVYGANTRDHGEYCKIVVMPIDVTAVIVTYNSADMVADLVASLPAATNGLNVEVIVVDNGSADDTVDIVKQFPDVRVIEAENNGYAAGINLGVRAAESRTSAILILNPDVRMDRGSVRCLLEALNRDGVGICAPKVRDADGNLHMSLRREPTLSRALGLSRMRAPRWSEYVQERTAYEFAHEVDWALGAVLLVSRRCSDAVGEWDESYFLYSEETDYCLRAAELGFTTWFDPRSEVVHIGGQSGQNDETHVMQIVNRVRLYSRRHGRMRSYLYFALTTLSELTWIARGSAKSRASVKALLHPSSRPVALNAGPHLLPK